MALVTDVLIIKRGDAPPPGYILVDKTVGGKSVPFRAAPLIGGISLALAVRRSDDPFVVCDIKIADTGSEAVPQGFDMIARTPGGCEWKSSLVIKIDCFVDDSKPREPPNSRVQDLHVHQEGTAI